MKYLLLSIVALAILLLSFQSCAENPRVVLKTSKGDIEVELFASKAPVTVKNFLSYVAADGYKGTIFHRVIAGFMIQTGGHYADMTELPVAEPIKNEADNGLLNKVGTLAMARFNEIDTARREFFINVNDNTSLDHRNDSCTRQDQLKQKQAAERGVYKPLTCKTFGYAVFGRVVAGMDVVEEIELSDTTERGIYMDVPVQPIVINEIVVL